MEAIILAGGYATRLWPITLNKPKSLLAVAGKPILNHIIEQLEDISEINNIYISTNKRFAPEFEEWLEGIDSKKKIKVLAEETRNEKEKLGCIKPIQQIIESENLKDDCLILGGDNLFSFEIKEFVREANGNPLVALHDLKDLSKASLYGVLSLDENNTVTSFEEKPKMPKSTLISMACYLLPADTLHLFEKYLEQDDPPKSIGSYIQWMHEKVKMKGFVSDTPWYDIGDSESYIKANIEISKGENIIHGCLKDSHATKSYIGKESVIENSKLVNCIVFDNVCIKNCNLRDCVVDENSQLHNLNLKDSVVGSHTKIKIE